MKPGAVLVDVAIDQGGCFETSRPTTHDDPTYIIDGVDFDKNPENHMFERNGEPINIAEYFMQMYQVRITDMR